MTLMRRESYVFDTNTLVSATLLKWSVPRPALTRAVVTGALLFSDRTLSELSTVLARPKFDRYVTREEREAFLIDLVEQAHVLMVPGTIIACRDSHDALFLDLAVHHPFRALPILTPRPSVRALR